MDSSPVAASLPAMRAFHNPADAHHTPGFFLMRGTVRPNFEVPARAAALRDGLSALGIAPKVPPPAGRDALARVHGADYLDWLAGAHDAWSALDGAGPEVVANIHPSPEMLTQGGRPSAAAVGRAGWFTADTACPVGAGTWGAAVGAAGCALAAATVAAGGGTAYALCRPPGHHAYAARAGGHCYLNNAAVAVEALRAAGAARVAVLDVDSHHGNGTQGIFWDRADVLTVSVHGDPDGYYPWFVGRAGEAGGGAGEGLNLNLPLPMGTSDDGWLDAVRTGLDRVAAFRPDALVLSLGFDASEHEPLAALRVTADGFAWAAGAISSAALPTVIVQEGGYAVDHLAALLTRFLGAGR